MQLSILLATTLLGLALAMPAQLDVQKALDWKQQIPRQRPGKNGSNAKGGFPGSKEYPTQEENKLQPTFKEIWEQGTNKVFPESPLSKEDLKGLTFLIKLYKDMNKSKYGHHLSVTEILPVFAQDYPTLHRQIQAAIRVGEALKENMSYRSRSVFDFFTENLDQDLGNENEWFEEFERRVESLPQRNVEEIGELFYNVMLAFNEAKFE
ncbi:hypothetical protein L596_023233 [Steinernema carpocapsae]|uniref:SXP/RAL-2 family protein Ani s 5-like cation-binding domain-containing protein n=2 Tax=Steinernema carpocapsae TaxID=34508 RepID=A0A4U5MD20_STECR|nr:hypothetical protein L596_023233 [Steinernema carpocapsae]